MPKAPLPTLTHSDQCFSIPLINKRSSDTLHVEHFQWKEPVSDFSLMVEQWTPEKRIRELVQKIRCMFKTMTLGEISISAYDTAWVAMVPSLNCPDYPQFPNCLDWIINNQLPDGSWGDRELFLAYDRMCSSLACLVALQSWSVGHSNIEKGLAFVHENIFRLHHEVDDYMPIGFEVVFPTLLDDARSLGLDLPYDSPAVEKFRQAREKKLKRIPMELLHSRPTTLLHSLEGLHRIVDWERLLRLQSENGSFLFSPASTACALKYTGNQKCLDYLNLVLGKFKDAVPNVYPVDLFERMWVVDRLERLGISHYFENEIKECLEYVFRYWNNKGICWASSSDVSDVDDTATAFRLLRLQGYPVSSDVFNHFKKGSEFFCFEGQTSQAVTGMYNLYRASQIMFPGESVLEEAKSFSRSFLLKRKSENRIQDKWILSKGLKDEVNYALNNNWYESLPKIETRNYIDQYGVEDVWIGKSLYRMFLVNNDAFRNLAIENYNFCQSCHKREFSQLLRWYGIQRFQSLNFVPASAINTFFLISATLFEPKYSDARTVSTMCSILATTLKGLFHSVIPLEDLKQLASAARRWDPRILESSSKDIKHVFSILYSTVDTISQRAIKAQGRDISSYLRNEWRKFIESLLIEAEWSFNKYCPKLEEYFINAKITTGLRPVMLATIFFMGEKINENHFQHSSFEQALDLIALLGRVKSDVHGFYNNSSRNQNRLSCVSLYHGENPKRNAVEVFGHFESMMDETMKEIVKEILQTSNLPKQWTALVLRMTKTINFFFNKLNGSLPSFSHMSPYADLALFSTIGYQENIQDCTTQKYLFPDSLFMKKV
ncbi:hypothetical protein KP509_09G016800 [Ceratopteris richardii]|uniref:Uncharacterized protein n=1 Tax=Ceratopteris richardii TaxID=49495 RepID=A0A8T2U5P8_CERRI|nr:hypothetical protein KP509_09G016800 [Ceratopteris richardii]